MLLKIVMLIDQKLNYYDYHARASYVMCTVYLWHMSIYATQRKLLKFSRGYQDNVYLYQENFLRQEDEVCKAMFLVCFLKKQQFC